MIYKKVYTQGMCNSKIWYKKDYRDTRMVIGCPQKILNGKSSIEVVEEELKKEHVG
jgi:hypothetical protein